MTLPSILQRIHPADNAIVALRDLAAGERVDLGGESWVLAEPVAAKHKFAAVDLNPGDLVTLYGVVVGRVTSAVRRGAWLHTGNLVHEAADCAGKRAAVSWTPPDAGRWRGGVFQGFKRSDTVSGTANHWIVVPLVFCESRNLRVMREAMQRALGLSETGKFERYARSLADELRRGGDDEALARVALEEEGGSGAGPLFKNLSGLQFLDHGLGCGGTRQDAEALCRLLAGYVAHPNVAGATILSLGCQHAQVSLLERALEEFHPRFNRPLLVFEQQKIGSESRLIQTAILETMRGMARADLQRREPCPLSDLTLGVECGGSDGFSGISANPAIGHAADLLAALGGTPVLSEFPELCGVEQSLCDRCVTAELADRFLHLMREYQAAARACGSGFESNPSPGNIRDGLITDAMKSAGAAKKGGTSPIVGVLDYGEPVTARGGLNLCRTPGNDVESTTGLAAAGCNVMVFSTGLGTPTGNPVCPTLKVSTSTALAERMQDIIDHDAGPIITGAQSVAENGAALLELILRTASGEFTPRAVALGQSDFLPWKRGVSL
jgi:altronate hydrolase